MSLFFNMNESGRIETIKGKWASDEFRIPAGTPISANGEIANNGNAVGILVSEARLRRTYPLSIAPAIEVKSPKGRFDYEYRVITAGFVNKTEAEKEYGEAYTAEAKSAMQNINFVDETNPNSLGGGASYWNDLEDKPFGEEIGVSDTITWDGVKGDVYAELELPLYEPVNLLYNRVSDSTPESEAILGSTVVVGSSTASKFAHTVTEEYLNVIDDMVQVVHPNTPVPIVIITYRDGAEFNMGQTIVFPKKGVYFSNISVIESGEVIAMCDSFTIPNYEFTTTVVKKIDPKYLPDFTLTAPNGTKYALAVADDGTLSAVAVE